MFSTRTLYTVVRDVHILPCFFFILPPARKDEDDQVKCELILKLKAGSYFCARAPAFFNQCEILVWIELKLERVSNGFSNLCIRVFMCALLLFATVYFSNVLVQYCAPAPSKQSCRTADQWEKAGAMRPSRGLMVSLRSHPYKKRNAKYKLPSILVL